MEIRLNRSVVRAIEAMVHSIADSQISDYSAYWESLRPRTDLEVFQRYLFAFCSVHTSFTGNMMGYTAIKDYDWAGNPGQLKSKLAASGCGLSNRRTQFISKFEQDFWRNPDDYKLHDSEDHRFTRNDISGRILGLGLAKVSFALEMCDPCGAQLVCADVHHLRMYGLEGLSYTSGSGMSVYMAAENHWLDVCNDRGVPPYIARCIYWDKIQSEPSSRYWSHVLEQPRSNTGYTL